MDLGICHVRKAEIISEVMEEALWNANQLGDHNPKALICTVVFLLGLNLGLRAGEHRNLRREMFTVSYTFCNVNLYML